MRTLIRKTKLKTPPIIILKDLRKTDKMDHLFRCAERGNIFKYQTKPNLHFFESEIQIFERFPGFSKKMLINVGGVASQISYVVTQ